MPAKYCFLQLAMLFFVGFAQIKADSIPDGIVPKRQVVGTGVTTSTPMSSTTDTPTSSDSSSETPSPSTSVPEPTTTGPGTTSSEEPSATPSSDSSTTEPPSTDVPTTIPVTTTNSDGLTVTTDITTSTRIPVSPTPTSSDTDLVVVGSSTIDRDTLSSATIITSALVTTEIIPATRTSVWTTNGQVLSTTYTTDQVVESTTGFATATISPSLQGGNGGGSSLSPSSKKIIGGVVGGIGGAILLGGLAVVAWRLWGKKRRQRIPQDDNDIFGHSPQDSVGKESRYSGNAYQNQAGSVNTASNF